MGIVNGISIVNNLIAGSMSGAQLQTYLATGANLASFVQVVNVRRQLQVLRNTPAAVTAVSASATASAAIAANDEALRIWVLYGTSLNYRSFANFAAVLGSGSAMSVLAESSDAMSALVGIPAAMAAMIATPTALSEVVASSTAMTVVANSPAGMGMVVASSTAMTAVAASSTAMTAVAASGTAMPILAASSTAMGTVAASSTAMAALVASASAMATAAASSTAKMAFFGNDVALSAIAGSSVALTALRAAAGYAMVNALGSNTARAIPGTVVGGSYILVGISTSNGSGASINPLATRRSGSARPLTAVPGSLASNATTVTMCTPLVSPFTFTTSTGTEYTWYFGLLRCNV